MAKVNLPTSGIYADSLLQDPFELNLKIINGILLTPRELDIIACVVGKRSAKKIAAFLSISPKTVENHIHNIKCKIGCNSKDGIIDFVEKSKNYTLIMKYYEDLRKEPVELQKHLEMPMDFTSGQKKQEETTVKIKNNNSLIKLILNKQALSGMTLIFLFVCIIFLMFTEVKIFDLLKLNVQVKNPISWNIPRQDNIFIERKELLENLYFKLHKNNITENSGTNALAISACAGLGGIGKTQLALQYIHHTEHRYTLKAWFSAENLDQLRQKYIEFSKELGYQDEKPKFEAAKAYIKLWLEAHPGWLLIYDNVENYKDIAPFLPDKGGHIIITTRDRSWPNEFQILSINIMTEKEAVSLMQALIKHDIEKETSHVKELVHILGFLPLAIAQAGSYIQQNHISIAEYLKLYKNYEQILLTDNTLPEGTNTLPVAITWNISLNAITKQSKTSFEASLTHELLTVCAYLAPEKISRQVLLSWLQKAYPNLPFPEITLNKCISQLWRYSMINYDGNNFISIHRLVQVVLRHQHKHPINVSKKNCAPTTKWFQVLLDSIHGTFKLSSNLLEDDYHKKSLLPHLQILMEHYDNQVWNNPGLSETLSKVLKDIADIFHWHMKDPHSAKPYYERALKLKEAYYGKEHIEVAEILTDYGDVYGALGNPRKQKEILERALIIKEKHYGKNSQKLIRTLESLGAAYWALGNARNGIEILKRGLIIGEYYYGKEDINIARTLYFLGNSHGDLGNMKQKKTYVERALKIFEKNYGKKHLQTSFALADLGIAHHALGEMQIGKELLIRAVSIKEHYLGNDHVEVGETLGNLSSVYLDLGETVKAKKLLERAVTILEQNYGKDHVYVARTLNYLGDAHVNSGDFEKACKILEHTLAIKEKYYDKDHISIAITLTSLGRVYINLGKYKQGKELLERALKIKENYYGNEHLEVALTLLNLAKVNMILKEFKHSLPMAKRCYEIFLKNYGEYNTNTKKSLNLIQEHMKQLPSNLEVVFSELCQG